MNRVACAANLQKFSGMLVESWAFSIAVDASANHGSSCLDARIRLRKGGQLRDLRLLAAPMSGSRAGERMRRLASKAMNSIAVGWRERLVGASAIRAPSMLGARQGFASRLEKEIVAGFHKAPRAAHQPNLAAQSSAQELHDSAFIDELNAAIGRLRRQQKLVEEMKAMRPRYVSAR